ncbi:MAG TPA: polyphenol oxidase family protein [Thermoanaerobaculia bacterium]|nr:polyphenol oxidase family protein [Thermoanaerobaculia bacterium]
MPGPQGPTLRGGFWTWTDRQEDVEVLFTGRGPTNDREEILRAVAPDAPPLAWAKQIHSAVVLPARPGVCGEGDAVVTAGPGLTVAVVTADCVPILIAGPEGLAAVHAGWRGIVNGVIPAALERMTGDPGERTAWIGPAIGACCYEVGDDVAAQVIAASAPEVARRGPTAKPHLDLQAAARIQLERAGVGRVHVVSHCTRCDAGKLWSYRREGKGAGRNLAFLWRRAPPRDSFL